MTRTFLDAGVLIAAARGIGIIPVRAHAILDDAERTFVTSELSLSRLNVKCRQNLEIRYYGANVATSCFLECQNPGELKSR